jgi:hypothetical protein
VSSAVRDEIKTLKLSAHRLALETCTKPKSEREYLVACGKVQQMLADAKALEDRFFAPEMPDPETDLDPDDDGRQRSNRVDAARARHRPRSM